MARIEHFNDPNAPVANSLVPAASAVVAEQTGAILLIERTDNGLWTIPGGGMEVGETIAHTAIREVKEETGLDVAVQRLVGVYSDPRHVIEYSDGEVRQQFSVCFACALTGGQLTTSSESRRVGFFRPEDINTMPVHESIRRRIRDYLESHSQPVIA